MNTRHYISFLLSLFLSIGTLAAQNSNRLYIPELTALPGSTLSIPVYVENTTEIVAVQFTLQVPEGSALTTSSAALTNRAADHTVTLRTTAPKEYLCVIYSSTNSPLKGRTGKIMTVDMPVPESYAEGSVHPFVLKDVVLSLRDGTNVLSSAEAGSLTIIKRPDLYVKNVQTDKTEYAPGENMNVGWQVQNIGGKETGDGWSEQISLVQTDGTSILLGTTYYDEILSASGSVSRQVSLNLPQLLGIDGHANVQVQVIPRPNTGENEGARGNNIATTASALNISKLLTLTVPTGSIAETYTQPIRCTLARSGNRTQEQTFTLTATADSRLTVPQNVTIPVGQSAANFYIQIADNTVLDDNGQITLTASGNGYEAVSGQFSIEDNEFPDLTVTASKSQITEGETFQLTITTNRAPVVDMEVTLTSENNKRFSFPATVTIPAGKTSVTFDVTAVDDELPSLELSNAFTASAPKYNKAEAIVLLKDNDLPVLELTLTPNKVQENAGVVAVAGMLRRTTNTNSKITVKLTDDADGGLYFGNRTLVLDKGVEEVHFNFGPVDNAIVDGDRTYTITAAVWLSSCSCNASGASAGYVEAQLQVLDNDGAALNVTSSLSTVKEGGKTTLTVSRNTTNTSKALTVTLKSDYDEGLTYNHTVTIPAGQQSTTVEVTSAANSVQGDSHTVIFTVEAEGYASSTCYLMVTDQTLPDARISSITSDVTEAEVGTKVKLTIEVTNDGAAELPAEIPVKVYLRGDATAVGTVYTSEAITVGGIQIVAKTIDLPTTVGQHSYYAIVNQENKVQELTYNNNTSEDVIVNTTAPFSISVSTDKAIYTQGEKILITGQLTGNGTANTEVDLYVINEGARQVQSVTTDANGQFTYEWQLYARQSGHFSVGACYPGEGLKTEMTTFDVYGLRRSNSNYVKCEIANGETAKGQVDIYNPGVLELTDVKVVVLSSPGNCEATVNIPTIISGGQTVQLSYSLKGTAPSEERKWYDVKVQITTNEGVTLDATIYFYCFNNTATLVANTNRINTTITKGTTRDYPIQIVNTGKGESGAITLSLPEWMTCASGTTIPSMSQNDTVTVVLRMTTNNKMQLNVPVTGAIGVNCTNGNGLTISYSVEPVSEEKGTLVVDVCDEYTYNTVEAPHVKGAEVIVRHPYTGVEVTRGYTGDDGTYSLELPEGYYKVEVSADKHEQYTNYCNVNPGKTENLVVNISYQPIIVQWGVEETEVEDKYEITTTVVYETNVPMPVVKVNLPKSIDGDNMAVGDVVIINMLLTNVGLINAQDVTLDLPANKTEWKFEALAYNEPFVLAPQQMVTVPVKITRIADGSQSIAHMRRAPSNTNFYNNCLAALGAGYDYLCGTDLKNNAAAERMAMKMCATAGTVQGIVDALGSIFGGGGGGGSLGGPGGGGVGGGVGRGTTNYNQVSQTLDICDPCDAARLEAKVNTALGFTWLGPVNEALSLGAEAAQKAREDGHKPSVGWYVRKIGSIAIDELKGEVLDLTIVRKNLVDKVVVDNMLDFWSLGDGIYQIITACNDIEPLADNAISEETLSRPASRHSWVKAFDETAIAYLEQLHVMESLMLYAFGDKIWLEDMDQQKADFIRFVHSLPEDVIPTDEDLLAHKPESVTLSQMRAYVNHVYGLDGEYSFTEETIEEALDKFAELNEGAINRGYMSMTEEFLSAYDSYSKQYDDMAESSVCASITLQFKQTMAMTRQAFRGTLTVFNGHEGIAMEDIKLNIEVKNTLTGEVATSHEFQINGESLDGFSGNVELSGGWTLAANSTGTATILFIPTKYAAPEEPVDWSFGGTLSYIDPFTGLEVTRELYPVTLTVKPSPELDLTYFMQRDIYGDDPLTEDVVEPMVPAEFALLINNIGNGDATNVRMVTNQPEIIENEKGLAINFEILSAQLNGGDKTMALGGSVATDFGTIPAHSQAYAQWWLQSSLLGHFTDYDVKATHVTSYGNPDLSLLNDVTIHELIRSIKVGDGSITGFVANDLPDAEDAPDIVYFTDGTTADVVIAANAVWQKQSSTEYLLTVTPSQAGWNYGHVNDPTFGYSKLTGIRRQSDGKEINLRNFWQTDRILCDGKDWLYEYRLHFVDDFASGGVQTYVLTFEPVPDVVLEVTAIGTVPAEGEIAEDPIEKLTVDFNKEIDATTFTGDDITFAVQGVKKNANQISISTEDNKRFTLDMTAMNDTLPNGYYTLTVQTADITDNEGYQGKTGMQVGWIMYRGGLVRLLTSVYPETSGSIQREATGEAKARRAPAVGNDEATAEYGSTITLRATSAEGYEFANWTLNGEVVGTSPELKTQAVSDMNIVANFTKKSYLVEVEAENGTIKGAGTGYYQYGEELTFTALPDADYIFTGWTVNGKNAGSDMTLTLTLNKVLDIKANFVRDIYHQQLILQRGWNWVSSYISEAWPIDDMSNRANRIVGQFDELINDPQFGLVGGLEQLTSGVAYKVEALNRFTTSFRGHLLPSSIDLKKGWNWIPYPWTEAIAVGTAITNAEDGDYLVSQRGFTEYADGYWEGTLQMLTPGEGYLYKSISNKQLRYDFTNVEQESHAKMFGVDAVTNEGVDVHRYPNTMNITARLYKDDEELTGGHYLVYAMANNELRGISEYIGNNYYITIYGDEPVDITFICESTETGSSYVANETLQFRDDVIGSRKSPFAITFGNTTGIEQWNGDQTPITVYSLEGILIGRNMTFKMLQKLPKGVYIINGQKCYVK